MAAAIIVDRPKTCPFLLRIFMKQHSHRSSECYRGPVSTLPSDSVIKVHTWKDATLEELAKLIKDTKGDFFMLLKFALVYPDRTGNPVVRQVGSVGVGADPLEKSKTLHELGFQIGDHLDVAWE